MCVYEFLSMCQKSVCVCQKSVCVCLIMCQKSMYVFAKEKVFVPVRICMFKVSVKSVCVLVCICTYVQSSREKFIFLG